jgi:hypothetical protein
MKIAMTLAVSLLVWREGSHARSTSLHRYIGVHASHITKAIRVAWLGSDWHSDRGTHSYCCASVEIPSPSHFR